MVGGEGVQTVYCTAKLFPGVEACSFCGHPALAWWRGRKDVSVSRSCRSFDAVPNLLADGMVGERPAPVARLRGELVRLTRTFWRTEAWPCGGSRESGEG
jgi:hypothetical protein